MKIHYGTALGAVALVAVHILMRMTQNFDQSLQYQNVIANYHFLPYALMLEVCVDTVICTWFQWSESNSFGDKTRIIL